MREPERKLTLYDSISIVIGIVIGTGIFITPQLVALNTAGSGMMILAWALGGLLCLCGALSYAELATAYPRIGGEYEFLFRSYGKLTAFLFGWARATVIQTGSIAALAYVFGDYMARLLPGFARTSLAWALLATIFLTLCNMIGLKTGTRTQNLLTAVKVAGVLGIIAAGFTATPAGVEPDPSPTGTSGAFGLAMVFVLYTYGGWNEAAYLAGEIRHERRNLLGVLIGSILLLTILYALANLAYLRVLGFEGLRSSQLVAADVMEQSVGGVGAAAISILIALSALGAINGCIFTGARSLCALAQDLPMLRGLSSWHERSSTPVRALGMQGLMAILLILLPGLGTPVRQLVGEGFEAAVEYTAPVFWFFLLLTGSSVFILRIKEPTQERFFRVPFYPVTSGVFCLMCAFMLYSSIAYTRVGALIGVGVLLAGLPLFFLSRRNSAVEPRNPH